MSNKNWSDLVFDFVILTDDGGRVEVRNKIADVIRWEKNNKRSFVDTRPGISDLMWLAWAAGKRAGLVTDDFDLWASRIEDFAADAVTHELDPTRPDQSAGSSHD